MELTATLNELFSQFFVLLHPEHKVPGRSSAAQGFCVPRMQTGEQDRPKWVSFYLKKGVLGSTGGKGGGLALLKSDPGSAGPHQERFRLSMRGLEELGSHRDHGKKKWKEKNLLQKCHACGFLRFSTGFLKKWDFWEGRRGTVSSSKGCNGGQRGTLLSLR